MIVCPCLGCKARYEACWVSCADYIAWKFVRNEALRQARERKSAELEVNGEEARRIERIRKAGR